MMAFTHQGVKIKHHHTLYEPRYSNLISGQMMGKHTLEMDKEEAILYKDGKKLYVMNVDTRGGVWKVVNNINGQELTRESSWYIYSESPAYRVEITTRQDAETGETCMVKRNRNMHERRCKKTQT